MVAFPHPDIEPSISPLQHEPSLASIFTKAFVEGEPHDASRSNAIDSNRLLRIFEQ